MFTTSGIPLLPKNRALGLRVALILALAFLLILNPSRTREAESYTREARLVAVGDIMMHSPQTKSGLNPHNGTYSFRHFFSEVKDILKSGDWVIGNLETPLAGPESGYTGYPRFNSPAELADALRDAGFNILGTANNHAMDRGESGVIRTLRHLRARGLTAVGTAVSRQEASRINIVEKNGIAMAVMAYTYGTNGIAAPKGREYLVSLIDETAIVRDIAAARRLGADVVTIMLHFGVEYRHLPDDRQLRLVDRLAEAGADVVLGSHPHVVQPWRVIERSTPEGTVRRTAVIYSLGNFISNQSGDFKDLGAVFDVLIRKHYPEGRVAIAEVRALPTWVHRYRRGGRMTYRVLSLPDILEERSDPLIGNDQYLVLEGYLDRMERHLGLLTQPAQETEGQVQE